MQGTVKGERRQGTERKRWEDNIREWRGLEFAKSQRTVENRGKWRQLVVRSSVVPKGIADDDDDDDYDDDDDDDHSWLFTDWEQQQKRLADGHNVTSARHADLVPDVTYTESRTQNGRTHTLFSRLLNIVFKLAHKLTINCECFFFFFFFLFPIYR